MLSSINNSLETGVDACNPVSDDVCIGMMATNFFYSVDTFCINHKSMRLVVSASL